MYNYIIIQSDRVCCRILNICYYDNCELYIREHMSLTHSTQTITDSIPVLMLPVTIIVVPILEQSLCIYIDITKHTKSVIINQQRNC